MAKKSKRNRKADKPIPIKQIAVTNLDMGRVMIYALSEDGRAFEYLTTQVKVLGGVALVGKWVQLSDLCDNNIIVQTVDEEDK